MLQVSARLEVPGRNQKMRVARGQFLLIRCVQFTNLAAPVYVLQIAERPVCEVLYLVTHQPKFSARVFHVLLCDVKHVCLELRALHVSYHKMQKLASKGPRRKVQVNEHTKLKQLTERPAELVSARYKKIHLRIQLLILNFSENLRKPLHFVGARGCK